MSPARRSCRRVGGLRHGIPLQHDRRGLSGRRVTRIRGVLALASALLDIAALIVAVLALLFTVSSFWWINARRGRLEVAQPRAYAFETKVRLRLPLVFYNTGAQALIVADMRVVIEGEGSRVFKWITTRSVLRPESDDGFAYATPFAVAGRGTKEVVTEFGDEVEGWSPSPGGMYRLRLEAVIHPGTTWVAMTTFDWWAPPADAHTSTYLTYRNEPR